MMRDQTGHKITARKRGATFHATKKWTANTQKVDRTPARLRARYRAILREEVNGTVVDP